MQTKPKKEGEKGLAALNPTPRVRTIAGEKVDVTKISTRTTIFLIERLNIRALEGSSLTLEDTIEIAALACQRSNPKITADFIKDNTDFEEMIEFVNWVMEPLQKFRKQKKGGDTKNPLNPSK
jgi:hypothetical protein